jgi:ubiquinone/menaquinone biosynthesis C-methylase UbiE
MYNNPEIYKNFLKWLFATFDVDETQFRKSLVEKLHLKPGNKVLITGCGLGNDIPTIRELVGTGLICVQDLSEQMINYVVDNFDDEHLYVSVSDAQQLPFGDNQFDATFHFGGINEFNNIKKAIFEMDRVTKSGGRIVFGDEGVASWLRGTDYSNMVINNNILWKHTAPIDKLPYTANNVELSWVLGNCFWVISYTKSEFLPYINPNIEHKSPRGGSMWSRYVESDYFKEKAK